ncbi:hypothetical protein D3C71_1534880 [compost metagenome]
MERATIVDPHDHRFAIVQVGDPGEARQRQRLVRGGEGVHVIHLAVGGQAAVELGAVIRSRALLGVAAGLVHHLVLLAQHHIRRFVADRRARQIDHFRLGDAGHVRDIGGSAVIHAGLVQAAGAVVTARARIFRGRLVGRPVRTMRRASALALHHRAGRFAAAGGAAPRFLRRTAAGGQCQYQQTRDQPSGACDRVHAGGNSCPAMAWDNWYTAIAYIFERL